MEIALLCQQYNVGEKPTVMLLLWLLLSSLTDRASTIHNNIRGCQSGKWSQRGTKVNGLHHGDNPLLRPTGIQIATKSYATLQAMAPTNNKTVHQTSFSPYREQPRSTRIVVAYPRPAFSATDRTNTFQPVLINNSKFLVLVANPNKLPGYIHTYFDWLILYLIEFSHSRATVRPFLTRKCFQEILGLEGSKISWEK